jgi:flagellar motor switch protein FliN/FliY
MATTHPLPGTAGVSGTAGGQPREAAGRLEAAAGQGRASEEALVPALAPVPEHEPIPLSPQVARLPVQLDVTIPIRDFRVRTLLALEPGQLLESQWVNGEDVPLVAGDVQLAWSEFEVVDTQLAVRLTRLM